MKYADGEYKFVALVDRTAAVPSIMNGLGHATAGLVSEPSVAAAGSFLSYDDQSGGKAARIARWPYILLAAKNSGQIGKVRSILEAAGVPSNHFALEMIGASAEDQLAATKTVATPKYLVLVTFGPAAVLDPVMRRFSLYRAQTGTTLSEMAVAGTAGAGER